MLGFFLATLINQIHLGVLVTSMLYSISNLYLFNIFLKERTLVLLLSVTLCLYMASYNGCFKRHAASYNGFIFVAGCSKSLQNTKKYLYY